MKKKILLILLIAVMVMIFVLSAQPATASSSLSRELTRKILEWFAFFRNLDEDIKLKIVSGLQFMVRKSAHFLVFALLGVLSAANFICYDKTKNKTVLFSVGFCLLYAISDEIHQYLVPGRSCELRDVTIDFCGSLFGILIFCFALYFVKKRRISR